MILFLISALILLGTFFILISGIGILKFPDTLCRAHALSKALTLGLMLLLIAFMITLGFAVSSLKIFLAVIFQFFTIPVAGHVFALYAKTDSSTHSQKTD